MEREKHFALVAMNAFKGTLTNQEACAAVFEGLKKGKIRANQLPIGDGGRGTIWTLFATFGGEIVHQPSVGPLGQPVDAKILCVPDSRAPKWIYLESAETCGHHLVPTENRDPLRASSQGLGVVLRRLASEWGGSLERIYIGLGDSAISDAGMGMLTALGYTFIDQSGRTLWGNADGLRSIDSFRAPKEPLPAHIKITVLCDVVNPLCGPNGSANVFAPQKGASAAQVKLIAQGMENLAKVILKSTGWRVAEEPMTGSAGGLAAACMVFLRAELVHGARFLLDWIDFDETLRAAAFVITGEGRSDRQTLQGKGPSEILSRAEQLGKKVFILSGELDPDFTEMLRNYRHVEAVAAGKEPSPAEALKQKASEIAGRMTPSASTLK